MKTFRRGDRQISLAYLPDHNDIVIDTDGVKWTVKREGGFKLRFDGQCHPNFIHGPLDALSFAEWFNFAFGETWPTCKYCDGKHPAGCCAQDGKD